MSISKETRNERICELLRSGTLSQAEVARKYGLSPTRVSQLAAKCGIPKPGVRRRGRRRAQESLAAQRAQVGQRMDSVDELLLNMHEDGKTHAEMAAAVGLSVKAVGKRLLALPVKRRRQWSSPGREAFMRRIQERATKVQDLYALGLRVEEIALRMRISVSTVRDDIRRAAR